MKQVAEGYRKIRNTMRFVLGNLNDFKASDLVEIKDLPGVDQYMLAKLNELMKAYDEAYANYDFATANQEILNYFTNTLSSFYMDFTKDILYIEDANSPRRRQVQTVLYHHAKTMMKLLSTVLVFTAEELHDHFHCDETKAESIFLEPKYELFDIENEEEVLAYFSKFMEVRIDVLKSMEGLRNEKLIKSNMETKVTLSLKDEYKDIANLKDDLKQLFIVAKVELVDDTTLEEYEMPVVDYAIPTYYVVACAEASSNLSRYDGIKYGYRSPNGDNLLDVFYNSRSEGFGMEVKRRIMLGSFVLSSGYYDAYYLKALRTKALIKQAFDKAFAKYDVILGPAAPTTAPKLGESLSDPIKMYLGDIYTISVNLAGLPGISVPGSLDSKGLPIGIQFIGDCFKEKNIIRAAYAFEQSREFTNWSLSGKEEK